MIHDREITYFPSNSYVLSLNNGVKSWHPTNHSHLCNIEISYLKGKFVI